MAMKDGVLLKLRPLTAHGGYSMDENEKVKYEIARELGLIEKVMKDGWKSLSPKETGRIGGLVNKRKRTQIQESQQI